MKKTALGITTTLILLILTVSWIFSSMVITPRNRPIEQTGFDDYPLPEELKVTTLDGLELSGWYFDNPNDSIQCGMILAHGWGSNRTRMDDFFPFFWVRGCDIVLYDHRAHGLSEGDYGTWTIKERQDLKIVADWMQQKTSLTGAQIGLAGKSWGAATVLMAGATEDQRYAFILADSPYSSIDAAVMERAKKSYGSWTEWLKPIIYQFVAWRAEFDPAGVDLVKDAKKIKTPTLLIHSQTDQATGSWQSVAISESLDPVTSTFHHTDWGSRHCRDARDYPARYNDLITEFLNEKVGGWPSLSY